MSNPSVSLGVCRFLPGPRAYSLSKPVLGFVCWVFLCGVPAHALATNYHNFASSIEDAPVIVSEPTSTRAIAMDSVTRTREPFPVVSRFGGGTERTRIMLFVMNMTGAQSQGASNVSVDAEDGQHRHYDLAVECVAAVTEQPWLTLLIVKVNNNLGDVGDVLIRVTYNANVSNRVRVAIGHIGGGLADDPGALPTPVRPFRVSGKIVDDNNQPLAGLPVLLQDRTAGSTANIVTSPDGSYVFDTIVPGHDVTVGPIGNNIFSFGNRSFDLMSGDRSSDFAATRRKYSIAGTVNASLSFGKAGVSVTLSGHRAASAVTDNQGSFIFSDLPAGYDYSISVATTSYHTFSSQTFTNLSDDLTPAFNGVARNYTLSGRVSFGPNDAPCLTVTVSGSQNSSVVTDAQGRYSITLPAGGDYTVSTSYNFFGFTPASRSVSLLNSDYTYWDFVAARKTFSISGRVIDENNQPIVGQQVELTSDNLLIDHFWTTTTNSNGLYSFGNLDAGYNYIVNPPSTPAYTLTPRSLPQLARDEVVDFTGLWRFILSGKVRDTNGKGMIGIPVTLTGTESGSTATAADGSYSFLVTATGNYTVTPSIPQSYYSFAPVQQSFTNLGAAQTTDFVATLEPISDPTYVLQYDGDPKTVDYGPFWQEHEDLGHFYWEFWAMPGEYAAATYVLSDGYGGGHALLFGVANFGNSEPGRYQLLGNIFDGVHVNYFSSDYGPVPNEWGHMAAGWDGQNIVTYYDGVPVGKTPFVGPRRTPGPGGGGGRLLIGGSDHNNFQGRIAEVRGFENRNPREENGSSVEASFAPETIFSKDGNFLSWYFKPAEREIADLSDGYKGMTHPGWMRGTITGIIQYCASCPPPKFVLDPTAPQFVPNVASQPAPTPTPPGIPAGALVFDSFSRTNSTWMFVGNGGLGSTESGSLGPLTWQTDREPSTHQAFGILNGLAVLLANDTAVNWVPLGGSDLDVRVARHKGMWGSGTNTGLSFRLVDRLNYFFAYTSDGISGQTLTLGYFENGEKTIISEGTSLPSSWSTLRIVTRAGGAIEVYADDTSLYSGVSNLFAGATNAGLYSNGPGLGLVNRWDNFTVLSAP